MTVSKESIGFEYKGVLYGKSTSVHSELTAGDVNQDNVIDVLDAIAIQEAWNTNNRAADIDFNGTVDSKDISYVKKNYFLQNSDVENAPAPTKTKDGKTLESILKELGVN
ncbi:dockerin type I domain-containing protein [Metabacillus idriensis]|nr:dockerin type I domain-containing protein [Metabacillus idriensis]